MKILFSADWHIKLGQKNVPREWQKNRYKMLFSKIHDIDADLHILGGDIFDTLPKPDEIALFLEFVANSNKPTIIYDGNHEATRKGKTFLTFFKDAVNHINKDVEIIDGLKTFALGNEEEPVMIDFVPYTHLKTFNPEDCPSDICCTHVRGNIPPHVVEEVDLELFAGWKTVLAGDLHAHSNSQKNILYPGSPLAITFHRNAVDNGIILFDTKDHSYEFVPLGLPQLLRKTVSSKEEIVKTEYDHTIYEVTGNILELAGVDTSSDLIDKKLIKRQTDAVLNLHNLTVDEELRQYLEQVAQLQGNIDDIIKVFNDYNDTGLEME